MNAPDLHLDRQLARLLRDVADKAILSRYRNLALADIAEKSRGDIVTVADSEAEAMLIEGLARIDPSIAMVAEEQAHADPSVLDQLKADCWIVDPLDGTHNFAAGKPPFGIIVARSSGGECQSGWLYDCLSGRLCHAHRGKGAFVNGEPIRARPTGESRPVAAISRLYLDDAMRALLDRHVAPHYRLVDIPRCAAEQYPRLALGVNDISTFERTLPWDHGAGVLWLNEAGGKAARFDGRAYRVDEYDAKGLLAASSPALWEEFLALLRRARAED